jgi:hypothetical protein
VFVNKNGLGRFPEFRDQGVGGSNPLSPTIFSHSLKLVCYQIATTARHARNLFSRPTSAESAQKHGGYRPDSQKLGTEVCGHKTYTAHHSDVLRCATVSYHREMLLVISDVRIRRGFFP